jgi:hypothetical protein
VSLHFSTTGINFEERILRSSCRDFFERKFANFQNLGHFYKTCKKFQVCRREAIFSVPLRKESYFFSFSLLCRRFETSQRCLTLFWQKSAFFGLFGLFSNFYFFASLVFLTKNALKLIRVFGKYFFSHVKKDNLVLIIFGHF